MLKHPRWDLAKCSGESWNLGFQVTLLLGFDRVPLRIARRKVGPSAELGRELSHATSRASWRPKRQKKSPGDIFIQTLVKLLGLIGHESYNSDEWEEFHFHFVVGIVVMGNDREIQEGDMRLWGARGTLSMLGLTLILFHLPQMKRLEYVFWKFIPRNSCGKIILIIVGDGYMSEMTIRIGAWAWSVSLTAYSW